ncbi:hypothetical protein V6N13_034327 [Hibiscus sabdariffa]
MVDATDVNEDDVVYVLRYFHGGKFVSSPKFDYVDWKVDRLQVDPDRLCYWDIIRNVSAFGYLKKSKFVYYRIPAVTFNTASLVLVHDDDTVREVIKILKKKGSVDLYVACLEEVDTVNGGNAMVGSNVVGSSYDHEDHVVGQEHVEVEGGGRDDENRPQHVEVGLEGEDVRPKFAENEPQIGDNESIDGNGLEDVDVGPDAENGPKIVDNESSEDNGSEHVELGPEITDIWENHVDVDVDVGAGVADVNGNGADHVDVDDNGNGADHVDVGPDSENGSQHAENGLDSDNGPDHVDIGPEVNDVEPELGDDRPELADDGTTNDNGAEDGLDGSEEDAFLFNIDIRNDVDEEVEDIREKGRGKRHKEKAADREGQPVQPDNVDEGYRSSDKDGKLEGYETDYISSFDPGEYEDSEQSDDDAPRVRQSLLPRYDPNYVIPVWELGLRFDDNKQFKEAVRKYAFAKGVQLKIVKNEPNRTRFHCMKGCPWTLFASNDKKLRCYTVKTYNHVHKCYRTNKNKLISAKYIQKQFKDIILANPKMKVKTLKEMCKRELGVYASFNMCQRARKQVIKEFRESYVEEYANLWGYAAELLKSNPGSTVSIHVHRNDVNQAVFFRIYVCFQALKQGWKDVCRPFIGVDGCWLKTAKKGELLVAVGRDANNQMFPIAWAVVEVECASSWRWFLQKLFTDLEHPTDEGITLMSDQQKWKGMNRKLCFWNCVRSTYIEEFDDNLQKLEKLGPTSIEDLLQNPVQHWAKAYFSATPTCDVVDNNMTEAFNAWILDARCKPIISLLEDIRVMVMSRLHVKRTWASKWRTNISPKALEKLERNIEQSTHCRLVWNGDGGFEVQHGEDQHIVDMKQLKCTCKAWELSGIPVAMLYVPCTKRTRDLKIMYPIDPIQPPLVRTLPGRPKKKIKKDNDEPTKGKPILSNKGVVPTVASQNVASSTTSPPGMVHGTPQNVASPTTGPPRMVHGTTHNVASATTNPPGMVHSTTQNVASTISQSSNQSLASVSIVAPTTQPKPIKKTYKKKAQVVIGLYTDLKTEDQIWNPGTSTERVVTRASKRKIGETDPSQFQYHSKGKGLRWKGNTVVTIRQLQENVEIVRKKRGRPLKSQTLGTQSSQT